MEHLHHLPVKTEPLDEGARPRGVTCHAGRPRVKKKAARRSSGRAKMLQRSLPRQDRAPPAVGARERQDQAPPPRRAPVTTAGCRAFTPVLHRIVWPGKFKPDLPPRYDGTPDRAEFLQLYELSIRAANGDEKVMANVFRMALKDEARSWLLNLPAGSISS